MKKDDDLDRELRAHLELEAEELVAGGMPPTRRAPPRAAGSAT